MYMVRAIGFQIPKGIVPFVSGLFTCTLMMIYTTLFDPLDYGLISRALGISSIKSSPEQAKVDSEALLAIKFGCIAGFFGWLGIDFMTIGVRISKSALAQYAEQTGIIFPFLFDIFFFGRKLLGTDAIGLFLIIFLQSY